MDIVTVGIDLAKNVFALHGVDQSGKAVFTHVLNRGGRGVVSPLDAVR